MVECLFCGSEACCDGMCAEHYHEAVESGMYDDDYLEEFPDDDYRGLAGEENL